MTLEKLKQTFKAGETDVNNNKIHKCRVLRKKERKKEREKERENDANVPNEGKRAKRNFS